MAKPEWIARQSRRPSGWLGEVVARVMAIETQPANQLAVEALAPRPGETILELGCGHGKTLARLVQSGCAHVAGIDSSEVMVRVARARVRRWITAGRAEIALASSGHIPHPDARFDAALAVHVVYFWSAPETDLREIRRVLRPGGRLLLGYRPDDAGARAALPASVYALRAVDQIEALLEACGFTGIRSVERPIGATPFVLTEARRPSSDA